MSNGQFGKPGANRSVRARVRKEGRKPLKKVKMSVCNTKNTETIYTCIKKQRTKVIARSAFKMKSAT